MDLILSDILKLNNISILKKIAENKFNNKTDINNFIEKYNKENYIYFKTVKENNINIYKRRIKRLFDENL